MNSWYTLSRRERNGIACHPGSQSLGQCSPASPFIKPVGCYPPVFATVMFYHIITVTFQPGIVVLRQSSTYCIMRQCHFTSSATTCYVSTSVRRYGYGFPTSTTAFYLEKFSVLKGNFIWILTITCRFPRLFLLFIGLDFREVITIVPFQTKKQTVIETIIQRISLIPCHFCNSNIIVQPG